MQEKKEWTLMFYFGSDNALAPGLIPQLKSIKQAGFHKEVNIIAQFDPQPEGTPTHIFDINLVKKLRSKDVAQIGFDVLSPEDPFISNLIDDKLWRDEEDRTGKRVRERLIANLNVKGTPYFPNEPPATTKHVPRVNNNGTPTRTTVAQKPPKRKSKAAQEQTREEELNPRESLQALLNFCAEKYPARHYILFIIGHGVVVANDIFLFDEHADQQSLSLKGLREVLTNFKTTLKEKVPDAEFEMVSFHSCSVSSLEVAYELQGMANYMLASQGPAFVGSWPYRQILIRLFKDTTNLQELDAQAEQLKEAAQTQEARYVKEEIRKKIKEMFVKITDYCFHHNRDFLLAGYSFDVSLCDLTNVSAYLTKSLLRLKDALLAGLDDLLLRNFILLAHLEAQSHWQESYTDLYDFCFCLSRQCTEFSDRLEKDCSEAMDATLVKLYNIVRECEVMRMLLLSHHEGDGNGVIIKSEFVGPEYQYSHGLSVYFPWSQPIAERLIFADYEEYIFHTKTRWLDFLKGYFNDTRRQPSKAEDNIARAAASLPPEEQKAEEAFEEDLANLVFNNATPMGAEPSVGQLGDKTKVTDPTGDACACPSIKNYPHDTRDFRTRTKQAPKSTDSSNAPVLQSQNFSLFS